MCNGADRQGAEALEFALESFPPGVPLPALIGAQAAILRELLHRASFPRPEGHRRLDIAGLTMRCLDRAAQGLFPGGEEACLEVLFQSLRELQGDPAPPLEP